MAEKVRRAKREVHKADALAEKIQNKYQVWFLVYARSTLLWKTMLPCVVENIGAGIFPLYFFYQAEPLIYIELKETRQSFISFFY